MSDTQEENKVSDLLLVCPACDGVIDEAALAVHPDLTDDTPTPECVRSPHKTAP